MNIPPRFANLPLSESERQILYMKEISGIPGSYGKYIDGLRVEFIRHTFGGWSYKIHTHKRTLYETSPGFIESKPRFNYDGPALHAAQKTIDLYWMACNETD